MQSIPTIVPALVFTTVVAALLWGWFLRLGGRANRYLPLIVVGLFSSAIVNVFVKGPIGLLVTNVAGVGRALTAWTPVWVLAIALVTAPITEEAIKVAPLLARRVRALILDDRDALWVAMALGISFGLGEVVWVGVQIAANSTYAAIPWYAFGGFVTERLVVCFGHGVMAAMTVSTLRSPTRRWRGFVGAVAMHTVANLGAFLAMLDVVSGDIASLWTVGALLVLVAIFERFRRQVAQAEHHRSTPPSAVTIYLSGPP